MCEKKCAQRGDNKGQRGSCINVTSLMASYAIALPGHQRCASKAHLDPPSPHQPTNENFICFSFVWLNKGWWVGTLFQTSNMFEFG